MACLHTAASNVAVFEAALERLGVAGVALSHCVRADLLAAAEAAGGLTEAVADETARALRGLAGDVVLLTCSTLGPAVERVTARVPVLRADAALARLAVAGGGRVVVLCAAPTTLAPTRALFEAAARGAAARGTAARGAAEVKVEVRLVAGAWAAFKAGDEAGYLGLVARAAEAALDGGAARVALAQASMTSAAGLVRGRRPLDSASAGLAAAVSAARPCLGGAEDLRGGHHMTAVRPPST